MVNAYAHAVFGLGYLKPSTALIVHIQCRKFSTFAVNLLAP